LRGGFEASDTLRDGFGRLLFASARGTDLLNSADFGFVKLRLLAFELDSRVRTHDRSECDFLVRPG
jgi:hypothetical protein